MFAKLASLCFFLSTLLLLLVSLSVPIVKSLYIFELTADVSSSFLDSEASDSVRFGVWGYCSSGAQVK